MSEKPIQAIHPDFNLATAADSLFVPLIVIRPAVTYMRSNIDVEQIVVSSDMPKEIGLQLYEDLNKKYVAYFNESKQHHFFVYDTQNKSFDSAETLGMQRAIRKFRELTIGQTQMSPVFDEFNRYFAGSAIMPQIDHKKGPEIKAMIYNELVNFLITPSLVDQLNKVTQKGMDTKYAWLKTAQACTTMLLEAYRQYSLVQHDIHPPSAGHAVLEPSIPQE